jgi:hypothetical protein
MYCSTQSTVAMATDHDETCKDIMEEIKECPLPVPQRHQRSTSVYAPMVSIKNGVGSNSGSNDILSWVKADPRRSDVEPLGG